MIYLISNFRRVLNGVIFRLGTSPVSELPRRKHIVWYN